MPILCCSLSTDGGGCYCSSVSGGDALLSPAPLLGHPGTWSDWSGHAALERYTPTAVVGTGAFAKVFRGRCHDSGEEVAMKVVFRHKPNVSAEQWRVLRNEAHLLSLVDHPNIVQLKEFYEDERQLVMILEMLNGGEVLGYLKTIAQYSERAAAALFRQQLTAVAHLHSRGVIHRDIKPENIIVQKMVSGRDHSDEDGHGNGTHAVVKVIDLGMACQVNATESQPRGVLGTVGFVAPEVCAELPHSPAMDIWSMGIMLYVMLCGKLPYTNKQIEAMEYVNIPFRLSPGFLAEEFTSLSSSSQDMITKMLTICPDRRATASELLGHSWITQTNAPNAPLLTSVSAGARQIATYRSTRGMANCVVIQTDDGAPESGDSSSTSNDAPADFQGASRFEDSECRISTRKLRFDPEQFAHNFHDDRRTRNFSKRSDRPRRQRRMGQVTQWSESLRRGISNVLANKSVMQQKSSGGATQRVTLLIDGGVQNNEEPAVRRTGSGFNAGSGSRGTNRQQQLRPTGSSLQ